MNVRQRILMQHAAVAKGGEEEILHHRQGEGNRTFGHFHP